MQEGELRPSSNKFLWIGRGINIQKPNYVGLGALVLAQVELIFFIVASVRLCFGFVLNAVLIIQGCFHYCRAVLTQSQGLFCFSPRPISEEAGGAWEAGRGHSWDS